jgi:FAD synthetase
MSAQSLLSKYVKNSEKVLTQIKFKQDTQTPLKDQVSEVVDYAKRYLSDAKYYGEKQQYETALASIAYCEGILDALRLLCLVEFTWPEA